jgi:hypothetical protein
MTAMYFEKFKKKWSDSWCGFDLVELGRLAAARLTKVERWLIRLNFLMLLLALVGFLLNHLFIHYFVPVNYIGFIPGSFIIVLLLWIWASANRSDFPKTSNLLLSVFYTVLCSFCLGVFALAVMLTPSPWVLSHQLLTIDQLLGFHQITVMHWMGKHLAVAQSLENAYEFWHWEVLLVAPVLVCAKQFPRACRFLLYSSILSLLFCVIYVIWPSLSPAAVFPQHIFGDTCYTCIHRFQLIREHHHYAFGTCGLIDFPSYHAALAMLCIWAFWRVKGLNVVMTALNVWVILATFLLGYHFLIDVIAAFVIVVFMLFIGYKKAAQ